jgi:hypothetical protein
VGGVSETVGNICGVRLGEPLSFLAQTDHGSVPQSCHLEIIGRARDGEGERRRDWGFFQSKDLVPVESGAGAPEQQHRRHQLVGAPRGRAQAGGSATSEVLAGPERRRIRSMLSQSGQGLPAVDVARPLHSHHR